MKKLITMICLLLLANCVKMEESDTNDNFNKIYQREICDKYSLYANTKDLDGSLSLYADNAIVNNSAVAPIVGKDKIKENFIEWYESAETINHSAKVISAQIFGNKAFAYGSWEVDQIMKDGSKREEINFKDGKNDGPWTRWYKNGKKEEESNFKDGKLNGLSTKWDKDGKKTYQKNFIDGEEQ